ncbi:glycosyltransferase family 2 protein [Aestuariibaculum sp. M13]|uniref:glycosyltransferase family 2 protein n=1 Tax=Aestuariibaculum sp. M13 TaxID=2967132 RepID=UPI002159EADE|nr:glycosyltransferase family 2 protein [Aestuariibaculum sp. M13]MCR8667201.1 glycosyltransferase family 2 protein [Aestuariibaculum sp. M13]
MKIISVLITSFNRKSKTIKCLEKLFSQNEGDFNLKVFLVDDGSSDGTSEAIREKYPQVIILQGDGNLYWNRGMYKAWAEASKEGADCYLWLNDDTFLYEDAINNMLKALDIVEKESIIIGTTCSISNKELTTYGCRDDKKVIQNDGVMRECKTFNGNCVLVPSSVYSKLGNLDYKFRHSFGDIEYGMRADKYGIKAFNVSNHIGTCELHDSLKSCFSPKVSINNRFKHFYSPLGMNPFEFFYLNNKYKGFFAALKVFITTHVRVLFPHLWLSN